MLSTRSGDGVHEVWGWGCKEESVFTGSLSPPSCFCLWGGKGLNKLRVEAVLPLESWTLAHTAHIGENTEICFKCYLLCTVLSEAAEVPIFHPTSLSQSHHHHLTSQWQLLAPCWPIYPRLGHTAARTPGSTWGLSWWVSERLWLTLWDISSGGLLAGGTIAAVVVAVPECTISCYFCFK